MCNRPNTPPPDTDVEFTLYTRTFCVVCAGCHRDGPDAATPEQAVAAARMRGWICADDGSANACPDCQVEQRR